MNRKRFNQLVRTKKWEGGYCATGTFNGFDMFQIAKTKQQAIDNLFRRLTTNWQDSNFLNQEQD